MNKKADTRLAIIYFFEIFLSFLIVYAAFSSLQSQVDREEIVKSEYSIHYAYYTTLLASSPDNIVITSVENKDYVLDHFIGYTNYAGVTTTDDPLKIYKVFPFIMPNVENQFDSSYVNKFVYFINNRNTISVSDNRASTKNENDKK